MNFTALLGAAMRYYADVPVKCRGCGMDSMAMTPPMKDGDDMLTLLMCRSCGRMEARLSLGDGRSMKRVLKPANPARITAMLVIKFLFNRDELLEFFKDG